jgi:hypothetical protein
MHRSGTSALTRVLSLLGATLPQSLYPATPENKEGHWEPAEVVRLHDEILESAGTHVNAVWDPETDWLGSPAALRFKARIKDIVAVEYGDSPLFVIKDPRISLVLPLWTAALDEMGIAQCAVVCFRNPIEVAQSLARRQTTHFPYSAWPYDKSGLLWLRYILAAERHTRAIPRAFHDYADLLSAWRASVMRLACALEIEWPRQSVSVENEIEAFLNPELRHYHDATLNAASLGRIWDDWIAPVHEELKKAKTGAVLDRAVLERVAAAYQGNVRALGRYLAAVETRNDELAKEITAIGVQQLARSRELEDLRAALTAQREYSGRTLSKSWETIYKIQLEREAERAKSRAEIGALQERLKSAEAELARARARREKRTKPFRKAHKWLRKKIWPKVAP